MIDGSLLCIALHRGAITSLTDDHGDDHLNGVDKETAMPHGMLGPNFPSKTKKMGRNQMGHGKALSMRKKKKEQELNDICLPDSAVFDPTVAGGARHLSKEQRMRTVGLQKYKREMMAKQKEWKEAAAKGAQQDASKILEDSRTTTREQSAKRDPKNPTLARVMGALKNHEGSCTYAQIIDDVDGSTWRKRPEGETALALVSLRELKKLSYEATAEKSHRCLYDGHEPPYESGVLGLPTDAEVLVSIVPETGNHIIRDDDQHDEHYSMLEEHADGEVRLTAAGRSLLSVCLLLVACSHLAFACYPTASGQTHDVFFALSSSRNREDMAATDGTRLPTAAQQK